MLSNLWRFLVALCDLRALARLLTGHAAVDVVFITNLRDEAERQRFFQGWVPPAGHAAGPRIYLKGVAARVRGIYVTAEEMMTSAGRRKAREQFIAATEWAEHKGARVILLAASTKRLFGRDARELKARFPKLLFTIGDNGTAQMLVADIFASLHAAGLTHSARLLVIGPYGILGDCVCRELLRAGFEVLGYGANKPALAETATRHGILVDHELANLGRVDAVIACTHSTAAKLTPAQVEQLRRPGRKLLVVDVAEPANLDIEAYQQCRAQVVRQDAGNAYAPTLHYVLGSLSWRLLMLSRGVVFGCFAEAMSLYHAIYRHGEVDLLEQDWFQVNDSLRARVARTLDNIGFRPPAPRCFGEAVSDFALDLPRAQAEATGISTEKQLPLPGSECMASR
ncbi:hypothetical protein [Uliginosibacterium sediminicola]|uniref:Quinate/shikimate 5-dehydrogenase/glutamyl-tRNA reductase domain-containing protein n=1 Tax=Uliginosibacterium sediminicola TaxID=2024550 RepID=A0ABU9Z3H3_9RHOO